MASKSAVQREKGELEEIRKEKEQVKEIVSDEDLELVDVAVPLVDHAEELRVWIFDSVCTVAFFLVIEFSTSEIHSFVVWTAQKSAF